ncbi:Tyrosine recombinase XerD [BD1-7 clade bacterium]|uniref:Tyrosine recombinase XerD n=1 Tax=BD1-7 clade bacterium TaxID=2029982 RepID=A0A5S9PCZ3_9GAMM|nr:Tyrosine recombinase XerD [BD1-7 clade bacterium]CAA0101683.1 Tyrosine recombinase XerD [BD1-7 clade bacterium]
MAVKKSGSSWLVDLYPFGRNGKRVRKKFDTKLEAQRFEKYALSKAYESKEWNSGNGDSRKLSELITLWVANHGQTLRDSTRRETKLRSICDALGDPQAKRLKPEQYLAYRDVRLQSGLSAKTANNELGYISAVFNELHRTQIIDYENPLKAIRPIKISQNELSYLTNNQIEELLNQIEATAENPHTLLITKICLSTGARWGEAEDLFDRHIRNNSITFTDTKSGKNRTVPICEELAHELHTHGSGKLFAPAISSFRRALAKTTIKLPKGQATHVLRHSFASHFVMNGGNILTLQKIMGHSTINMTMRYAHLSPDHLLDAVNLNPLANIE